MYSILKSQKRSLLHKKPSTVTSSIFLTNNHILLTFTDCSCSIYFLDLFNLEQITQNKHMIWQMYTEVPIIQTKRIVDGKAVLLCNNYVSLYVVEMWEILGEGRVEVGVRELEMSQFGEVMGAQAENGVINGLGCQTRMHAFKNGCFVIQHYAFDDRKVILDCYKYEGKENQKGTWKLKVIQIDLEINGHFVIETINDQIGKIAIYKQQEFNDANWVLRVLSPFTQLDEQSQNQNPHIPYQQNEIRIILPSGLFNQDTNILQICQYVDDAYLIITNSKTTGELRGLALYGLAKNVVGNASQLLFNFEEIGEGKLQFLGQDFKKILHANPKDHLYIVETHQHQTIDGELYFNGLIICNMKTGNLIQKGYCSLRKIDFSPNCRYILDMPSEYDKVYAKQTLFHVRSLLSKTSLYMSLMEGWNAVDQLGSAFKNMIIDLL